MIKLLKLLGFRFVIVDGGVYKASYDRVYNMYTVNLGGYPRMIDSDGGVRGTEHKVRWL